MVGRISDLLNKLGQFYMQSLQPGSFSLYSGMIKDANSTRSLANVDKPPATATKRGT